jgi:hypothetical protein
MIEKLMFEIETYEFAARLNIASSFKVFWRAASQEESIKELIKQLADCPGKSWWVFKRAIELSQKEIDSEYENPWDTALAVYLWVLSMINLEMAQSTAEFVIQAENGWWSTKFAQSLLKSHKHLSGASFQKHKIEFSSAKQESVSQGKIDLLLPEKPVSIARDNKSVKRSSLTWKEIDSKGNLPSITYRNSTVKSSA